MSIVELAEEESERRGGLHIIAVHLRLGLLAGVVKDALLSSYEMACENTALAGSQLVVEEVPGIVYCPACDARASRALARNGFAAPNAASLASEIVQGKELEVVSLEVEQ